MGSFVLLSWLDFPLLFLLFPDCDGICVGPEYCSRKVEHGCVAWIERDWKVMGEKMKS
jgi:hypothetical protein